MQLLAWHHCPHLQAVTAALSIKRAGKVLSLCQDLCCMTNIGLWTLWGAACRSWCWTYGTIAHMHKLWQIVLQCTLTMRSLHILKRCIQELLLEVWHHCPRSQAVAAALSNGQAGKDGVSQPRDVFLGSATAPLTALLTKPQVSRVACV